MTVKFNGIKDLFFKLGSYRIAIYLFINICLFSVFDISTAEMAFLNILLISTDLIEIFRVIKICSELNYFHIDLISNLFCLSVIL